MTKKLLWFSDSVLIPTGYANISLRICKLLAEQYGWEVDYVSHNYLGKVLEKGWSDGVTIYPFKMYGQGREGFCKDVLNPVIKYEGAHVCVTLLDTFMVWPWYCDYDFAPARTVFYFPSDGGGGLPQNCDNVLRRMTLPVAMSKYAQNQAKKVHNIDSIYIPHAVDSNHYKPYGEEQKNVLRSQWNLMGKYVVGVVARNQGRKTLDFTIKSFADFCKDKPEAVLLMHTDPLDPAAVFDLRALVNRYGIANRVIWTGATFYAGFPYERMPDVYNLMDVFLLTTSGEGWGVPTTEAMSCQIPVIVTDYTTTQEIVTDHGAGLAVPIATEVTGNWLVERAMGSVPNFVEALNKLYYNPELRTTMGVNGRKAVLAEYNWDLVAKQWDETLTRLIQW